MACDRHTGSTSLISPSTMSRMPRTPIPILSQLKGYSRDTFRNDLVAGLTVGVMLIPQGMAYALIAGVPPIYGLYASLIPLLVYALFGTSRQLSVAPVAMMSLLAAAGVAPLAGNDPERYLALMLMLAFMVGVIQLAMGLARFGFLTHFLSHPILAGFTSAAALIIGFSQLKHLLGISIPRSHHVHEIIHHAAQHIGEVHLFTLAIGAASILLLVTMKRWNRAIPGALIVVMAATLAAWGLSLVDRGVRIVGDVPEGLPHFELPGVVWADLQALLPAALVISLVGFIESIAVAKIYASRNRYDVDANQELIGLGLANIAGSAFQAFPTAGGFGRTAVNAQAGAKTQVAAVISVCIIALTLLLLTPLFYHLPNSTLAAIVMVAVFGLIDLKELRYLWRVDRKDFALMLFTFLATLGLGIEQGILVGVAASLLLVLHQSSDPHTAIEGRLPGTNTYRNVERNPEAETVPGVVIFRMDESLYFGNASLFKEKLRAILNDHDPLHTLILNFFPVNRIDSSATHALHEIVTELQQRGVQIRFSGVKGPVRDVMEKAGLVELIGPSLFFHEVHEAMHDVERSASNGMTSPQTPHPSFHGDPFSA